MATFTPEQIARASEFVERWTKVTHSVEAANRSLAEVAFEAINKASGHSKPKQVVWFDSPQQMVTEVAKIDPSVRGGYTINSALYSANNRVNSQIAKAGGNVYWDEVWNYVVLQTRRQAHFPNGMVTFPLKGSWGNMWGLQTDTAAEVEFYRDVLGFVKEANDMVGYCLLTRACHKAITCRKMNFASERPIMQKRNSRNRLHCDDGPAVLYKDGWSIFAVNGVPVSERVVMNPGSFTVRELKKMNLDRLFIIFEKLGMEKFMAIKGNKPELWNGEGGLFSMIANKVMAK